MVNRKGKKKASTVVVTKTSVPAEDTLFPEKVKKANDLLAKTKLLPEKH